MRLRPVLTLRWVNGLSVEENGCSLTVCLVYINIHSRGGGGGRPLLIFSSYSINILYIQIKGKMATISGGVLN